MSYSAVWRFVRSLEPREPTAWVRIETAPGEEAQVDFGTAGHEACRRRCDVLFTSASRMLAQLHGGRADGTYGRRLASYLRPDLLIVDDFGLKPLHPPAPEDLYEIVNERYERGSLIVNSNRAFSEWPDLFQSPLLASAALDRLAHNAYQIVITGGKVYHPVAEIGEYPSAMAATRLLRIIEAGAEQLRRKGPEVDGPPIVRRTHVQRLAGGVRRVLVRCVGPPGAGTAPAGESALHRRRLLLQQH